MKSNSRINRILSILVILLSGCSVEPEPITFGKDVCDYCKMIISDEKYGGELVTQKGRIYKFDAVECVVNYIAENNDDYRYTMAVAYDKPENLFSVDSLKFVVSEKYSSPMGANLAAFINEDAVDTDEGNWMNWEEIRKYIRTK